MHNAEASLRGCSIFRLRPGVTWLERAEQVCVQGAREGESCVQIASAVSGARESHECKDFRCTRSHHMSS
jgi:hypothetical protein